MRVIAGIARSLPLKAPEGMDTRPTTDRIKETLFNVMQTQVPGSIFLDLFSGSGAIGIEAISRGAKKAYFIDQAPRAVSCIEQNLAFTKFTDRGIVIRQDVQAALYGIREKQADIIFMDPPYNEGYEKQVLSMLRSLPYVTEDTLIVVEAALNTSFDYLEAMGYELVKEKRYKTNQHLFLRLVSRGTCPGKEELELET